VPILKKIAERGTWAMVLLDNAPYHKSGLTRGELNLLNLYPVFNVVACPDLNAIEKIFSMLKSNYKKKRLAMLRN
jgi:transposase